MGWQIGGSPQRAKGIVCHNERCKQRDKATSTCLMKAKMVCRDRKTERKVR